MNQSLPPRLPPEFGVFLNRAAAVPALSGADSQAVTRQLTEAITALSAALAQELAEASWVCGDTPEKRLDLYLQHNSWGAFFSVEIASADFQGITPWSCGCAEPAQAEAHVGVNASILTAGRGAPARIEVAFDEGPLSVVDLVVIVDPPEPVRLGVLFELVLESLRPTVLLRPGEPALLLDPAVLTAPAIRRLAFASQPSDLLHDAFRVLEFEALQALGSRVVAPVAAHKSLQDNPATEALRQHLTRAGPVAGSGSPYGMVDQFSGILLGDGPLGHPRAAAAHPHLCAENALGKPGDDAMPAIRSSFCE